MKSKGFTLIELLAVIVVLAIIALIATPIVINIIGNSKESADDRSAELYLHAVEQAVAHKNLSGKFSPTTCEIQSDGNLKCDGDTLLEVQVENTKPTSGTITFERGKISDYTFEINSKEYTNVLLTPDYCFETKDVEGGVEITKYRCAKNMYNEDEILSDTEILDVIIPSTIGGKQVVSIGEGALLAYNLTSVEIPNTVTTIGMNALGYNALTNIEIPDGVTTIGNAAFANNKLTSVKIPSRIKAINGATFYQSYLFSVEIPDSVESIEPLAFYRNQLTSIKIPDGVTTIGAQAFASNRIKSITIPSNVTSLGYMAFGFGIDKLESVIIKGKSSLSDFESFQTPVFEWADGYSDSNIIFEP